MSFQATLTVDGKKFNVLQSTHYVRQKVERGKTTSGVRGGVIILIVDGTDEELLGTWATGPTVKKDGEIIYDRIDQDSSLQKLEFQDAYLTMYLELTTATRMDAETVLGAIYDTQTLDLTNEDAHFKRIVSNTKALLRFPNEPKTATAFCSDSRRPKLNSTVLTTKTPDQWPNRSFRMLNWKAAKN